MPWDITMVYTSWDYSGKLLYLFILIKKGLREIWLCQSLWLCGSQYTVENSERNGNTRPTCLLRNLYAGQEARVGTGYGTTD